MPNQKLFVSDYVTDIVAIVTIVITLIWSVYILSIDKFTPFTHKKNMIQAIVAILLLQLCINLWMIVREILDDRFPFSNWKWLLLMHSVIVIMAIIWTIRCVSVTAIDVAWCQKSDKIIFGLLISTSTIYLLMVILEGPASARLISYMRSLYNGKKENQTIPLNKKKKIKK